MERERALRDAKKLVRTHTVRDKEREEKLPEIKIMKLREKQEEMAKKADVVRQNRI